MAKIKVFEIKGIFTPLSRKAPSGHLYLFGKNPKNPNVTAKVYNEIDQNYFESLQNFAEVTVLSKIFNKVVDVITSKSKECILIAYKAPEGKTVESESLRAVSRQQYMFLKTAEYPYPFVKIYVEAGNKEDIEYFQKNPDFFDATKDIIKQRKDEAEKFKKYNAMKMNDLRVIGKKYGVNDNDKSELAKEIIAKQRGN